MKKILKLFGKWMIAGMGLATGVILVYAATTVINSVTTQTINKGDQIGSGWFQEVNDKIMSLVNNQESMSGEIDNNTERLNEILTIGNQLNPGEDCKDILSKNSDFAGEDGTYWIDPDGEGGVSAFEVYCDMTTDGGGWTRLELETRQWGNSNGFGGDPISSHGTRVDGGSSKGELNNYTDCNGDSQVSLIWKNINGNQISSTQINSLNNIFTEGKGKFAAYDDDGQTNRGSIKGCYNDNVVMVGENTNLAGNVNWTSIYNLGVSNVSKIFTKGIYAGNGENSGSNNSLSKYWYFK